ncbi:hypothetical protein FO519_007835 [Halicephalobus sp. NKZ332]|nr:hypothetical protein FO519_007835 [Halicephalobus sp. NKZ332]
MNREEKPIFSVPITGKFEKSSELVKKEIVFESSLNRIKIHQASVEIDFKISCSEFHFSKNCNVICIPPSDGRYTCGKNGEKICKSGLGGPDCDEPSEKCKSTCLNGVCDSKGVCRCYDGYKGEKCDQCIPLPGCQGTCEKPYECNCPPGFGGKNCTYDLTECLRKKMCKNGGTCDLTFDGHQRCICPPGFAGNQCERRILSCEANPCTNGGKCEMLPGNIDYHCKCPKGFTGRFCHIKAETCRDRPCMNGGICKSPTESGFICECTNQWMGTNCDIPITQCRPESCFEGSKCIDDFSTDLGFRCEPVFWIRKSLSYKDISCSNYECKNGGICSESTGSPRCQCPKGFGGDHCEVELEDYDCTVHGCKYGRICQRTPVGNKCDCPRGFYGEYCQHEMPIVHMHDGYGRLNSGISVTGFCLGVVFVSSLLVFFAIFWMLWKSNAPPCPCNNPHIPCPPNASTTKKRTSLDGQYNPCEPSSNSCTTKKQASNVQCSQYNECTQCESSSASLTTKKRTSSDSQCNRHSSYKQNDQQDQYNQYEPRYVADPTWRPRTPKNLIEAAERAASRLNLQASPESPNSIYSEIPSPRI